MALLVEDNTGLVNAESYVTVAEYRAYCAGLGRDTAAYDEGQCEIALRMGFLYVNSNWRYKSSVKVNDQAGEFPRIDLSDGMGRVFNVVPKRVKDAQCEAAFVAHTEALFENLARGGKVQSESVGPISVTYEAGAPGGTLFVAVERLLAPFTRNDSEPRRPLPSFNDYAAEGREAPVFSVGMDDSPDANDYGD